MQLQDVHRKRAVDEAIRKVLRAVRSGATRVPGCRPGFQGGHLEDTAWWRPDLGIWCVYVLLDNRHWLAFGTTAPAGPGATMPITCEINPPVVGVNRRCSGLVAKREDGTVFLCHSGRINVTRRKANSPSFHEYLRGRKFRRASSTGPDGRSRDVVIVGAVEDPGFAGDLARFVQAADGYKASVRA